MKQFETQIRDFSQQFTEQIKCLDAKVSIDNGILGNILELYKRRAAIEQEYSDSLLKLSSSFYQRRQADNQKRTNWKSYSPANVLNSLLVSTQHIASAHKDLADIYGKQITQRLVDMQEDCFRLNKKSTDILQKRHAELIGYLNQLLVKHKHYIKIFNEADEARKRADRAMEQLDREVIRCQDKKKELDKNPRVKRLKDDYLERFNLFRSKQAESTNARNDYIINLLSLKDTINFFYSTELKAIVQCAEYGFHNNLTRFTMNHSSCEEALMTVHDSINKLFTDTIVKIDAKSDTQVFLDAHKSILTLKENLHFTPAKGDNINKIIKSKKVQNCLQNMYVDCSADVSSLNKFVEEGKLCLDTLSESLNGLINQNDYDVVDYICQHSQSDFKSIRERSTSLPRNGVSETMYTSLQKVVRDNKIKTEAKYFQALETYLLHEAKKISALTKLKHVESALSKESDDSDDQSDKNCPSIQKTTAVMIGIKSKLFGGDLNKYSNDTKEMVPVVVQSCICLINRHGMHNMGVFRVPGSQTEVQTFKAQFELGKDPLRGLKGTLNDVNLAASILKLYFRELEPPIFNEVNFNKIVENYNAAKRNEDSVVSFMKDLISSLEPPAYATLHYLLSFISHLAELSSDNCMDTLNLAIIFGPCLMPIPEDKSSQLFHYQSIVNYVAQCLITHHQTIFTKKSLGPVYQRKQDSTQDYSHKAAPSSAEIEKGKFFDNTFTGGSSDEIYKKTKSELNNLKRHETVRYPRSIERENPLLIRRNSDSVKHCDILALAVVDYHAKNDQELSFKNGNTILLKKKINENWWNGHVVKSPDRNSPTFTGLIPNAYISIYNHNELSPDNESTNLELVKQRDGDLSSPESQRLSGKSSHGHKRSMASIDSDNEVDFSPDDNRSLSHSLENTAGLSEFGESKSFGSFENIIDDDEYPISMKSEIDGDTDKDSVVVKATDTTDGQQNSSGCVKIRESRSSVTIYPESVDSNDGMDDDLEQTIQGLKRIEELNVIRHRNTVHIDKSLLTSKFISPLSSDHMTIFDMKNTTPPVTDEQCKLDPSGEINEFKIKKPGNVSTLASSFEMNKSSVLTSFVKPVELTTNSLNRTRPINKENPSLPPPILPRPKIFKK